MPELKKFRVKVLQPEEPTLFLSIKSDSVILCDSRGEVFLRAARLDVLAKGWSFEQLITELKLAGEWLGYDLEFEVAPAQKLFEGWFDGRTS